LITPLLINIPQYNGQELPEEYFNKINQIIKYGEILAIIEFNDKIKVEILLSKMAGKFIPLELEKVIIITPMIFLK
jgi:hypothetical protein